MILNTNDQAVSALAEWYDSARKKLERALPPSCYSDQALFKLEQAKIFRTQWVCVGRDSDLKKAGDYFAADVGGQALVILRGLDDEIAALSNVCRHRHALLLEGHGNVSGLSCPYHAWTYKLDGTLQATPFIDPLPIGCDLPRYPLEIWNGFVFVHLGKPTGSLVSRLAALEEELLHHELSRQVDVYRNEISIATNWKMMVENFTESYHLFRVHRQTLEPYTPTRLVEVGEPGQHFNRHYVYYNQQFREQPVARSIPAPYCDRELVVCIYPNLLIVAAQDSTVWACIAPRSAGDIRLVYGILQHQACEQEPGYKEIVADHIKLLEAFNAEDKAILESIFKGASAADAVSSILSTLEKPLLDFAMYYAAKMLA